MGSTCMFTGMVIPKAHACRGEKGGGGGVGWEADGNGNVRS